MTNTFKIILTGIAITILIISNILLFSRKTTLENQLSQVRQLAKAMQLDAENLTKEKEKITAEKDKLQDDIKSYIAGAEKLQIEKNTLKTGLEKAQKNLDSKEVELAHLRENLSKIESEISAKKADNESKLAKEAKELKKKIYILDKKTTTEKALLHYNLGVALTQAKRYSEALEEYRRSLQIDPSNADAHYNMALIYDNVLDNGANAVFHYRAYLNLRPKAIDKDDIEKAISHLKK